MKKLTVLLLAASLILALSGCAVEKAQSSQGRPPRGRRPPRRRATTVRRKARVGQRDRADRENVRHLHQRDLHQYDDYIARTIKLEGMYLEYYDPSQTTYYYVYRVGPGCCGNDARCAASEFTWNGEMPQDNDWIQVTGTLEKYDLDGQTYLTLKASDVEVESERARKRISVSGIPHARPSPPHLVKRRPKGGVESCTMAGARA